MKRYILGLICLPADCDSALPDSDSALKAIAHGVDALAAAFCDDTGEPDTGSATLNIYRLAGASERIAAALELMAKIQRKTFHSQTEVVCNQHEKFGCGDCNYCEPI